MTVMSLSVMVENRLEMIFSTLKVVYPLYMERKHLGEASLEPCNDGMMAIGRKWERLGLDYHHCLTLAGSQIDSQ